MEKLKRVSWQIGQPLLPMHLFAQEDSLLAHLHFYLQNQKFPFFGLGTVEWDEGLLQQGVISLTQLAAVFPTGEIVTMPGNGKIGSFDLNQTGKTVVSVYLHLLQETLPLEEERDEEKLVFALYQLALSTERHLPLTKTAFKFGEFEKDLEGRWRLSESFSPPLYTIHGTPFLTQKLFRLQALLEGFQKEQESSTGRIFEQKTIETKLCLTEVAKLRRFLLNAEKNKTTHPFYLYEAISQFLDHVALIYSDATEIPQLPYQHEKLAPLFSTLIDSLVRYLRPSSEKLSSLAFEKKDHYYLSEKIPQELDEVAEIYFIVQPTDPKQRLKMEGLKLASHSRLNNVYRFALSGVTLLRLESAPFNNNFSKQAVIYRVEKDLEWNFAIKEGRLAFSLQDQEERLQAYLYWR